MDNKFFEQKLDLFPEDPFVVHIPPAGQNFDSIVAPKKRNYSEMIDLARFFNGSSKALVSWAAFLSFQCHFNHFRGGKERPHYSIHLLEVAKRVDNNFDTFPGRYEQRFDRNNGSLMPKAIAISIALLHDAIEDFHENFRGLAIEISEQQAQTICENHIRKQAGILLGTEYGDWVVDLIRTLSIYNENEFPTINYLEKIKDNTFTYMVKLADVDHNMSTFPSYSPAYPVLIIPAQYSNFSIGTVYEKSFNKWLLMNVSAFDPDELVPWLPNTRIRTVDYLLSQLEKYEGKISIERIPNFYDRLLTDLSEGRYDILLGGMKLKNNRIVAQIGSILTAVEKHYHSNNKDHPRSLKNE